MEVKIERAHALSACGAEGSFAGLTANVPESEVTKKSPIER